MAMAAKSLGILLTTFLRRPSPSFLLSLRNNNNLSFSHHCTLGSPPPSPPLGSSGICQLAQAIKGDTDVLLKGVGDKNTIEEVKHILEMARRASSRREVFHSNFLTPPVLKESMLALEKVADVKAIAQGGYPQAERCRISVGQLEVLTSDPDTVAAMSITGNFGFQPCSHGDFLGAILGTGIARNRLGDILLQGEKGAQIVIDPDLVDFLIAALDQVGRVPVSCTKIPLSALDYEPPRTKTFKTVEASLRVDALASAGFKISRSKLVDLISNGEVRVNWTPVTKNGTVLKTGDIVSVSGKGRLKGVCGEFPISCITTIAILTSNPTLALLTTLTTMASIPQDIGASSIAATFPKPALVATSAAVVTVSEDVTTSCFAAIQQALPFVRRHSFANIVLGIGIATRAFPCNAS
ncbi:hypothetical protein TIFTF001_023637 [Ficus carica]|uniref:RNA-binding S4 domain-containing protein n=1 Tax=Ficus carica TaxID=3494 RepID=A0AA88AM34_FICCA|nr:hypothetical protein TIFTF001_023637 [Ficus carica]